MITRSLTHWGLYDFHTEGDRIIDITASPDDADPSPIGQNLLDGNTLKRIDRPAVRKGFLSGDQSSRRGHDEYISIEWEEALTLVAGELERVRTTHGNRAIFGGSYGWASAGRFHHALSQVHRFLNSIGGYTRSVNSYSYAAAEVILPHIVGDYEALLKSPNSWQDIAQHSNLMVCFGGLPLRNAQITNGGMSRHVQREGMQTAKTAGVNFINISPSRADCAEFLDATWLPARPGSDVALMLGLAHEIVRLQRHDLDFLSRYTHGFDEFLKYLMGVEDSTPKDPEWAAGITGLSALQIRSLAEAMTAGRTMISLSWSLSRHQHGEQPYWMGITLAAMLGQIGLPGGGIGLGYSAENKVGKNVRRRQIASLAQGQNQVDQFIPVARISDMLLAPGQPYRYDGQLLHYPDIRLIYWAGGNPFHHHQDLNKLQQAWQKPEVVICHELVWNTTALHSDIVLPVASFLERNDLGGAPNEDVLVAMKQALPPFGASKTDYEIFSLLADKLDAGESFTLGRSEQEWITHLYNETRTRHAELPEFAQFWDMGEYHFSPPPPHRLFEAFRNAPAEQPLSTDSGKIQITVPDMGHARWFEPAEWLGNTGKYPLHMISHQPANRLHSQLDQGAFSQQGKIDGREILHMNPADARDRNLTDRCIVRAFNERGAFYAGLKINPDLMPGVLHIATGAWWQPDEMGICRGGNPNAVTMDTGTSEIAQGPSALTCTVEVEQAKQEDTPQQRQRPD